MIGSSVRRNSVSEYSTLGGTSSNPQEEKNLMNVIGVYMDISLLDYTRLMLGAFFSARNIGKLESFN